MTEHGGQGRSRHGSGRCRPVRAFLLAYASAVAESDARELSRSLLATELPRRWAHTQGVARQAAAIAHVLGEHAEALRSAAWLHDIGYASPLVKCEFHPLDGARYLRDSEFSDRPVWTLVAHHTCALIEAEERGLAEELAAEFPASAVPPLAVAAMTYCDVTTSPDGRLVDAELRITEILSRYPAEHVVHRAISRAAPSLIAQVAEVVKLRSV